MIGVSHRSLGRRDQLSTGIARAAEQGLAAVEHVIPVGATDAPRPDRAWYRQRRIEVWATSGEEEPGAPTLADPADGARGAAARGRAAQLADAAASLACDLVLLEVGLAADGARGRALEHVCRNLHALLGERPEMRLALVPRADAAGAPSPGELRLVLDDLRHPRLGYWHAPDRCAWLAAQAGAEGRAAGAGVEAWLDADPSRARLFGAYLADLTDGRPGGLPGTGVIDWRALALELRSVPRLVLRVDAPCESQELRVAQRFLDGMGLRV